MSKKGNKLRDPHKARLMAGIMCVITAFVCGIGVVFLMMRQQVDRNQVVKDLENQKTTLTIEKEKIKSELDLLKSRPPRPINLDDVLAKAHNEYSWTEKDRKEGLLWIDRRTQTYVITLGALNGLRPGRHLTILDEQKEIGTVVVDTPMDVISYVRPIGNAFEALNKDYYRVTVE